MRYVIDMMTSSIYILFQGETMVQDCGFIQCMEGMIPVGNLSQFSYRC